MGNNVKLRGNVRIECDSVGGSVKIGCGSQVNHGSYLAANGGGNVHVGENCLIAHMVSLKATTHLIDSSPSACCIGGDAVFGDIRIGGGAGFAEVLLFFLM